MLSRRENKIMKIIYDKCSQKGTCLVSCDELINSIYPTEINEKEIQEILENLVLEEYISLIITEKNKKKTFCISLKERGEAFLREKQNKKKSWVVAITRTIILACISFVVGIILKAIIK